MRSHVSRRDVLRTAAATAAAASLGSAPLAGQDQSQGKAVQRGRIKQSLVYWCFTSAGEKWDIAQLCRAAVALGCPSVELCPPKYWADLKSHGLTCAIASSGVPRTGFMYGLNNPQFREEVIGHTRQTIDLCAAAGVPSVIAFTGFKWRDPADPKSGEIPADEGAEQCVKSLKELARHAEQQGVTVCLEHLNTRDHSHPMKGHPGYQGDDLDYVANIIRRVDSPRVKLLFDIYHVQVMHGDILRRLEQNKDILGHVHTAGCPGRGELDDRQELQYAPIMRKLLELGYQGYVGQEFIPTRNALEGLRQAVTVCDV